MKILHVWDQAGIACILAKFQRKFGHTVDIFKRDGYDPFGMFGFYSEPLLAIDGKKFINHVAKKAEDYDVIHVHSLYKIIPDLRKKYRNKKIILHYHGSEVRGKYIEDKRKEAELASDFILGSTPDLVNYVQNLRYVPNPIDTDHFRPIDHVKSGKALTIKTHLTDIPRAIEHIKFQGLDLEIDIIDRTINPIEYSKMPSYLAGYDLYVDIRWIEGILLKNLSKTALESLACGLQVLQHDLTRIQGLPTDNNPVKIVDELSKLYSG